MRLWTCAV